MTSQRRATLNRRWNSVVKGNIEICNLEQCWINIVYFNDNLNNVTQRRNNVVIFNADLYSAKQRRNNVLNMTIKKNEKINFGSRTQYFWVQIRWTQNLFQFASLVKEYCQRNSCKVVKHLKTMWVWCVIKTIFKLIHFENWFLTFEESLFRHIMINSVLIRI